MRWTNSHVSNRKVSCGEELADHGEDGAEATIVQKADSDAGETGEEETAWRRR
jgi:hypothetical protein